MVFGARSGDMVSQLEAVWSLTKEKMGQDVIMNFLLLKELGWVSLIFCFLATETYCDVNLTVSKDYFQLEFSVILGLSSCAILELFPTCSSELGLEP